MQQKGKLVAVIVQQYCINISPMETLRSFSYFCLCICIYCPKAHILLPTHTQTPRTPALHCTAEGDSFQLCVRRSVYLPEYRLTMVMGMNGCGAPSLTSSGVINGQTRTLKVPARPADCAPLKWRGQGTVWVSEVRVGYACVSIWRKASASLYVWMSVRCHFPLFVYQKEEQYVHGCLLITTGSSEHFKRLWYLPKLLQLL